MQPAAVQGMSEILLIGLVLASVTLMMLLVRLGFGAGNDGGAQRLVGGGPWRPLALNEQQQAAFERATHLLMEHLTPAQREEYERQWSLTVQAPSGNTYYLAADDIVAKIAGRLCRLCIVPVGRDLIPPADVVLARKLMIEADEERFLATATRWPLFG